MSRKLSRRDFLFLLGSIAGARVLSALLPSPLGPVRRWAARRRATAAAQLFRALVPSALRSVEVVVTGPHAYLSPLPPDQWPALLQRLVQLAPYDQLQKAPTSFGTLQLLLFTADPHLPQPIRLTWLEDPSVGPRTIIFTGEPWDAAFLDETIAPWLKSFITQPPVTGRAT